MKTGLNVLIIEDNPMDIVLLKEAFLRAGADWHITVANNGEKAISAFQKKDEFSDFSTPDLVLLDIKLPRVRGTEVLKYMRLQDDLNKIKVITITSSSSEKDRDEVLALGVDALFIKPMDIKGYDDMAARIMAIASKIN
jgi:CheY-like chemotaxis protein